MSALYTALVESESKEDLARMVVDLRAKNRKLIQTLVEHHTGVEYLGDRAMGLECALCGTAWEFEQPARHSCTCPIVACAAENSHSDGSPIKSGMTE